MLNFCNFLFSLDLNQGCGLLDLYYDLFYQEEQLAERRCQILHTNYLLLKWVWNGQFGEKFNILRGGIVVVVVIQNEYDRYSVEWYTIKLLFCMLWKTNRHKKKKKKKKIGRATR
eukprot:TRINITY_DN35710_c0_g1_i1.p5 TRINITY_DN35710_c0_g1~~TRINITY_DN35710_c0_g1_i1.p5  ORF type:complete len:115 (+),score=14.57 TRINITY_DN35710_c0_g1_i1:923-1267(+)